MASLGSGFTDDYGDLAGMLFDRECACDQD
jgi:hypothetical protein